MSLGCTTAQTDVPDRILRWIIDVQSLAVLVACQHTEPGRELVHRFIAGPIPFESAKRSTKKSARGREVLTASSATVGSALFPMVNHVMSFPTRAAHLIVPALRQPLMIFRLELVTRDRGSSRVDIAQTCARKGPIGMLVVKLRDPVIRMINIDIGRRAPVDTDTRVSEAHGCLHGARTYWLSIDRS